MKLISTSVTDSEVVTRFADDEDTKRSIDIRVPIGELEVPVREGWLKKLDRDIGLPHGPATTKIGEVDNHPLSEIKKAALERAQAILRERSNRYKDADEKPMVLAVQYMKYKLKWFYLSLVLIVISLIFSIALGLNETPLTVTLLSVPLLLYQGLTYLRVRQGLFGVNAGEAGELLAFLSKNKTMSGPTTPFLSEDEIKKAVLQACGRAAEVLP